jgi:hypothetical protein
MLSDSCHDFLTEFGEAAQALAQASHDYASPPSDYGEEVEALQRCAKQVAHDPFDPEAGAHLLRLALAIMRYHDAAPGNPNEEKLENEMLALTRLR